MLALTAGLAALWQRNREYYTFWTTYIERSCDTESELRDRMKEIEPDRSDPKISLIRYKRRGMWYGRIVYDDLGDVIHEGKELQEK